MLGAQGATKSFSAKRYHKGCAQAMRTLDWDTNLGGGGSPTECWRSTDVSVRCDQPAPEGGEPRVFAREGEAEHPRDGRRYETNTTNRVARKRAEEIVEGKDVGEPPQAREAASRPKRGCCPPLLFWVGGKLRDQDTSGSVFLFCAHGREGQAKL